MYASAHMIVPRRDMTRGDLPDFLAYEDIKAPITEGRRREPMILIFCWPRTLQFPDVPVFHGQPVGSASQQYGCIGIRLDSIFTAVMPTNELPPRLAPIYESFWASMHLLTELYMYLYHVLCMMSRIAMQCHPMSNAIDTQVLVLSCAAIRPSGTGPARLARAGQRQRHSSACGGCRLQRESRLCGGA